MSSIPREHDPELVTPLVGPASVEDENDAIADVHYSDILREFALLGWTAFGGPAAHLGMFQKRFVDKLHWMSSGLHMELVALGQCLPGPTSTQVSFAIGTIKQGVSGGLLGGVLFQYPGAIMMTIIGIGGAKFLVNPEPWLAAFIAGLSAVGVSLVASAAKGLVSKMCVDKLTGLICAFSAAASYYAHPAWLFPALILSGGLATLISSWKKDVEVKEEQGDIKHLGLGLKGGAALLLVWLLLLIGVEVSAHTVYAGQSGPLNWFEVFFRVGSLIYGGGQVVLPLLFTDLVKYDCDPRTPGCAESPETWVTATQFYTGLAAAQAMPGPLFNFSAYLGAIIAIRFGYNFLLGTVLAWLGLFGPGLLLLFGVMPFWGSFRRVQVYKKALPGLSAAAVGLVVASVVTMVLQVTQASPFRSSSMVIVMVGFVCVDLLHFFEPAVILGGGLLGVVAHYLNMH